MGKSDLIEKINARVKSQMSTLTARTAVKSKADDREVGTDTGDKRITSRTGTVVVRRRTPPRAEGEPGGARSLSGEQEGSEEYEDTARAAAPAPEPAPEVALPAPIVAASAEVGSIGPEPEAARPESAPRSVATETIASASPSPRPVPADPVPLVVDTQPARVTRPETVREVLVQPEAVRETRAAAAQDSEAGVTQAPEAGPALPAATVPPQRRNLEDVLAQEHGRVHVQHRAMVVGEARNSGGQRVEVTTRSSSIDRSVDLRNFPERTGERPPGGPGSSGLQSGPIGIRKPGVVSPTPVKEIAGDERKKEKGVVKAVPGRQGIGKTRAEEDADRQNKVARATKGTRRVSTTQRRDGGTQEGEPQFKKHRRPVAKREKAKPKLTTPKAIKRIIKIEDTITVGELAHRMGVKAPAVIKKLIPLGVMATVNQAVDHDTASVVASEFGYEVENVAFDEAVLLKGEADRSEDQTRRSPVVTIMGHVDHGKTTLLDAIRHTDVASREAGGITQHIGAYTVETEGGRIVFLDTPGHEAFTAMRARGAQVTDIVVLVVAADDGVMPQTVEALNHAKAAKVPIIVAVNKIDKPGANPERIRQKLLEYELVSEELGGDVIFEDVSAKTKVNIKQLLESILLQAEVLELRANLNLAGRGTVVESQLDKGRGPVATVLVTNGVLRVGDMVVVGAQHGKIRAMVDDHGKSIKEAGPSTPVEILGLSGVPEAGDTLAVVEDQEVARSIAENRSVKARDKGIIKSSRVTLEDLFSQMQKSDVKELRLILKTDVQGSLEALQKAISDLSTDAVKTTVLHSGVGAISEGDVMLASASRAIVIGFNVKPDQKASSVAEQEGVQVNTYSVIYEAMDDLKKAMLGLLKPILKEKVVGHAEVRETFSIPKIGLIAGSSVTDGKITRSSLARLMRGSKMLWEGRLGSLRRFKDDVKEVDKGYECGIGLDGWSDVKVGDVVEVYIIEETRPTL